MSIFAVPSLAEQAILLHSFVGRSSFSLDAACTVVNALIGIEESRLATSLRQQLKPQRVKLGHMQALQVAARLRGQRGLNDHKATAAFGFQFAAFGRDVTDVAFARFDDAVRAFVDGVSSVTAQLHQPFAATLTRNHRAVMCTFGEMLQPGSAIALLSLADESQIAAWIEGMSTFLESLRRSIEEAGKPGVLVGYACARYGTVGYKNSGEVEVWRGGLRVATGHELEAYSALLERWTPEQVGQATADGSSIRIGDELLHVVFALRETEPVLRVSNYVSPHPVTESLLKRAQRFARRDALRSMLKSPAEVRFPAGSGLPDAVLLNDEVLTRLLDERGLSIAGLAEHLEVEELELSGYLPIGLFVRLATHLKVADYNELVGRIPRDGWVDVQSTEVLQGLLDATDEVRFALSPNFTVEDSAAVNEAAQNLAASRWTAQQNRAGVVQGLDAAVHSVDAEEFLDELQGVDCIVRAGVKPFFTPIPDYELPAVGKRLVIAVLPAMPVTS